MVLLYKYTKWYEVKENAIEHCVTSSSNFCSVTQLSPQMLAGLLLLLGLGSVSAWSRTSVVLRPLARASMSVRRCSPRALFEDDPWLQSPERLPMSSDSLDVLFMYGPVVYAARCFDAGEYNASVRKFMERNPRISRQLAEQEVNEFLSDGVGYLARTTDPKYPGPKEEDLKPPVGTIDKVLVVLWVAILVPAASYLLQLCLALDPTDVPNPNMAATEALLDAAVELNQP